MAGAGEDRGRARERAMAAFHGCPTAPEVFVDGPLTLAFLNQPGRGLHVSETLVCLVEGALWEPSGGPAQLARSYERGDESILAALRGEFWALLWSRHALRGMVVADQMGTRGPYWAHDGATLVVASEVPELLAALPTQPAPDPVALAHWLLSTGPQAGTTLFAGVRSVRAGHRLRVSPGSQREERYWSPIYQEPMTAPRAEQVGLLRDRLETAVARRRAAGGGTGVLLSGGLDSSAVAALASRHGSLRAYSAVFPDHPSMDESELIGRTSRDLDIETTRLAVRGGSTIRGALDYTAAWKLPPTSPNLFFWTPLLAQAASDGIEVMLDGEGGDELFTFSPYLVADRLRAARFRSALALARRWPGDARPPSAELIWLRLRLAGAKPLMPAAAHRTYRRMRGLERYAPPWLPRPVAREWLAGETSAFAWKQIPGPRWWAYVVDTVTRGPGPAVVYEQSRRRSRLAGVVASHPLVDPDVIELALRIDPELSFEPRFSRTLLREAVAGLMPDEVRLRRTKSNFDALFHQLLAGPELPAARMLLDPERAALRAYVDMSALHEELLGRDPGEHPEGLARWAVRVWRLVTAEIWLRGQEGPESLAPLHRQLGMPCLEPSFEYFREADI